MIPEPKKIFSLAAVIFCAAACAQKPVVPKEEVSESSPARGEMIMTQVGSSIPVISSSDEKHWIQLKNSSDSSRDKLYGMLATGDWQPAVEEARLQLEKRPGDPAMIVALAAAYASGRNYEMAGYYGKLALKTDQSNSDAMNLVGLRVMMSAGNRRNDFDDALVWFRKATDNDGTNVAAPLNMGYLQLDLGDAPSAVESFGLAGNRCGNCYSARYGYGIASARMGSWTQAKSSFEGILSRENYRADAQYQLALVYKMGLGDTNKAISLLQNIVSDPDGRFRDAGNVKRVANITLRRMKASDRTGPSPEDTTMPHGGELPARQE
jgi:tetratricopeptide (TPR) repeat protein